MIISKDTFVADSSSKLREGARTAAVVTYLAILAWAPFPLGGAISWGAGFQGMLVAGCFGLWALSVWERPSEIWSNARLVVVPFVLVLLVLAWAVVQALPVVPLSWVHPLWSMTSDAIGQPLRGTISLAPWRTDAEILKLSSYVAACWLAFSLARRAETASLLLNAIIVIGALYAIYALVLALIGTNQARILYSLPVASTGVSGPFMQRNSFATYSGLATLAATAKLFELGSPSIITERGIRRLALTIVQFVFGRGAPILVALLLVFACVIATSSRAGFAATMCGLFALALTSLLVARKGSARVWSILGALLAILPLLILITANGDTLAERLSQLLDTGTADPARLALWAAARSMISGSPWLGLGLGTFQDAYPLYAVQVFPFVMDKAHCDYLEFTAGLGLPAASVWWCAMMWAISLCLRGVHGRRRHRVYPLVAVGASVLVAIHSSVDFSLQLPAVGLSYATLLGLGLAQSFSTRDGSSP